MASSKPEKSKDRFPIYVALAFGLGLVVLQLFNLLYWADQKWVDRMFLMRGVEDADPRISVVAIDAESLKEIGAYPWPRRIYSRLFDKLFSLGVEVVSLDILFLEPSNPMDDNALIEGTRKWRNKLIFASTVDESVLNTIKFLYPFEPLRRAAKHFGNVNQFSMIDDDGALRQEYKVIGNHKSNDRLINLSQWMQDPDHVSSLAIQTLVVYEGKPINEYLKSGNSIRLNIRGEEDIETNMKAQDQAGNEIPIKRVHYGIQRVPAWKILENSLTKDEKNSLKDGIVLVGSTAEGAFDHFPTPFTGLGPGVEVHATVVDNILNKRDLHGVPTLVTLVLIMAFAFFSALVISFPPLVASLTAIGAFFVWSFLNYFAFRHLLILDYTTPSAALIGTFVVLMIRRTMAEQKQKKQIENTFGRFVSKDVVKDLAENPDKATIGAQERDMTVFFLDIAHFTTISERIGSNIFEFLNVYLSALTEVIEEEQKGTVDKYIGDCVMAFWNAPLDQADHRARACLAALRCQEVMEHVNATHKFPFQLPEKPEARIGLNSGLMKVGFTGSKQKLQYTVIGDEVNLGSRLEGANKFFGSKIMVSEDCYSPAKDAVEARFLGAVKVIGKEKPIRVYELLAKKGRLNGGWSKALPLYEKGVGLFQKGIEWIQKKDSDKSAASFAEAKVAFNEVLKIIPEDGPSRVYANVSEDYSQIPPMDWNGVFNLTSK